MDRISSSDCSLILGLLFQLTDECVLEMALVIIDPSTPFVKFAVCPVDLEGLQAGGWEASYTEEEVWF